MKVQARWKGADEVLRKLRQLDANIAKRGIVESAFEAAEPMRAEVEKNAPVGPKSHRISKKNKERRPPGTLKSHIIKKVVNRTFHFIRVGVGTTHRAWYWRLVELGHKTPQGGNVPAHPFIRPSFENSKNESLRVFKLRIWDFIRREVK